VRNVFLNFIINDESVSFIRLLDLIIIIPILEELFFRGIIQNMFYKEFKWYVSIILTSLLFSFYHFNLEYLFSNFIFSLFSGFIYFKYSSLKSSIIFHSLINMGVYIVLSFF
jgi:membrane protease YdiL (CAAX protease family)